MPAKVEPGFIYGIRSNENGRIYIGQTKDINKRMTRHRSRLRKNKHFNKPLQEDFNKYGYDNFTLENIEKIEDGNRELLKERETFWIMQNKDFCYNIRGIDRKISKQEEKNNKGVDEKISKPGEKNNRRSTISISLKLRRKIKTAASFYGMTIPEYLNQAIENIYE